jgi:hypothetical protein
LLCLSDCYARSRGRNGNSGGLTRQARATQGQDRDANQTTQQRRTSHKILTRGVVPHLKCRNQEADHTEYLPMKLDYMVVKKDARVYARNVTSSAHCGNYATHSISRQLGPAQISTSSGTASLCTFSISSRTNLASLLRSLDGASKRSSSCTCRIILASNFSAASRR